MQQTSKNVRQWQLRMAQLNEHSSGRVLKVVDLFCGCGGLSLGCQKAANELQMGMKIELALDIDADATAVYKDNFGQENVVTASIDDVISNYRSSRLSKSETDLVSRISDLDVLVAGPPCQGHSDLNNRSRRSDPRNILYYKAARAVTLLMPKIAIIENVPTVVHDKGGVVDRAITLLQKAGYTIETGVVCFESLGLPQRRKRHVLLAHKMPLQFVLDELTSIPKKAVPLWPFIKDLVQSPSKNPRPFSQPAKCTDLNRSRIDFLFDNDLFDLPNSQRPGCHANGHSYKSMYGRLNPDLPAQTITTGFGSMGQGRYVHPTQRRLITPHEAARIQGFPDYFSFDNAKGITSMRKLIGNAVPPVLSHLIVSKAMVGMCQYV